MIRMLAAAALVALVATPVFAANQCRDKNGKFIKCPTTAPAKAKRCKDAKGKFARCGSPGAKPA